MGRSVSVPTNASVIAFQHLEPESWEDDDGIMRDPSEDDFRHEFESIVYYLKDHAPILWPSLRPHDEWIDREDHAVLQNDHAYVGVSEYCGVVALWVVPRTDDHGYHSTANLCEHWCAQISTKFEKTFGTMKVIGRFSNGEQIYRKT